MVNRCLHVGLAGAVLAACAGDPREPADPASGAVAADATSGATDTAQTSGEDLPASTSSGETPDEPTSSTSAADADAPLEHPAPGEWIAIEPGAFVMGALPEHACPMSSQNDIAHAVTLTHAFEISATEVTFTEYEAAMGSQHPHPTGCSDCPVHMVTWHDAAAVCNAYSDVADLPSCYACAPDDAGVTKCAPIGTAYECAGYRLPTEAEWEYAARAGTTDVVFAGEIEICSTADPLLDTIAWYLYDAGGSTHPVATKLANPWGLFDTSGNVWEWTHDAYVQDLSTLAEVDPVVDATTDGARVMRGGSYNCVPGEIRAAHRSGLPDVISGLNVGLRCARTL